VTEQTQTGPARKGSTERCANPDCGHTKRDHSGRADHRAHHAPLVAGEPWCHACNAECDYAPPAAAGVAPAADQTDGPFCGSEHAVHPRHRYMRGRKVYNCPGAAPAPVADQTLRDRIAEARDRLRGMALSLATGSGPLVELKQFDAAIDDLAAAVMAALPDQQAAFERAADVAEDVALRLRGECLLDQANGAYEVMAVLRRLAAGAQQQTDTETARLLDCGLCYEENGEEVHPHPECTVDRLAELEAEHQRWSAVHDLIERAIDKGVSAIDTCLVEDALGPVPAPVAQHPAADGEEDA
jgi:hypothetical protein